MAVGAQACHHAFDDAGLAEDLCVHGGFEGEDGVSGGSEVCRGGGITRDTGVMSLFLFDVFNFIHQMAISVDAG